MSKSTKLISCEQDDSTCYCPLQHEGNLAQRKQRRSAWESSFSKDPINLRELPKNVVLKARQIIQGLAGQKNYREFHGKRLRHDRAVVSIPVTRNYRLLCRDNGRYLIPFAVISHADYNVCKPGG